MKDSEVLYLAFLLPQDMLLSALELIDTHSGPSLFSNSVHRPAHPRPDDPPSPSSTTVQRITTPYSATLYSVSGSTQPYLVSPRNPTFCPCAAFAFSLVNTDDGGGGLEGVCKHLLALWIGLKLGAVVDDRLDVGGKEAGEERMLAILSEAGLKG